MSIANAGRGPYRAIFSRPVHAVGGDFHTGWYIDLQTTQVIHLEKGMAVTPIKQHGSGKVVCRTANRLLLIPEHEIEEIGWN